MVYLIVSHNWYENLSFDKLDFLVNLLNQIAVRYTLYLRWVLRRGGVVTLRGFKIHVDFEEVRKKVWSREFTLFSFQLHYTVIPVLSGMLRERNLSFLCRNWKGVRLHMVTNRECSQMEININIRLHSETDYTCHFRIRYVLRYISYMEILVRLQTKYRSFWRNFLFVISWQLFNQKHLAHTS